MTPGVKLTGDWARARVTFARMPGRWLRAIDTALVKEGHFIRGKIVQGISSGAPGGQAYKPLAPMTIAIRRAMGFGGSKPMNGRSGAFRGSIAVIRRGNDIFVGVRRSAKTASGRSLVDIAEMHEKGISYSYRMSPKQRRFWFAMLKRAGAPPLRAGGQSSGGITHVTIPARPTFGPVRQAFALPSMVERRMLDSIAAEMGGDLGSR